MLQFEAGQFTNEFATPDGVKLWEILNRPEVIARMETASDLGRPALEPVEDILLEELGEVILQDRYKQMAGKMVRQIMENQGFEHETSDVRLNSTPFYKASRYRRVDQDGVYLFKSSSDPRTICLSASRAVETLPAPERGRWMYVTYLTSPIKAQVGYRFDLKTMAKSVAKGPVIWRVERMLRPA
jgi:hypothetical protein